MDTLIAMNSGGIDRELLLADTGGNIYSATLILTRAVTAAGRKSTAGASVRAGKPDLILPATLLLSCFRAVRSYITRCNN